MCPVWANSHSVTGRCSINQLASLTAGWKYRLHVNSFCQRSWACVTVALIMCS